MMAESGAFRSVPEFLRLVITKVKLNLRAEAAKTHLSYAWWVLEPVLHMGAFYLVFEVFLNRGTADFVTFLFCGLVPWLWFSKSISNSCLTIKAGKGLIAQTRIPKVFFPLVSISQDLFKQLWVFLLLLFYLLLSGYNPSVVWLWMVPIVVVQFTLIAACAFLVAFLVPFALDLRYLVATLLTMGMLGSGVFYDIEQVLLPQHRVYFLLNPMANLIVNYRLVLMEGKAPMEGALLVIFLSSLLLIWLALLLMRRFDSSLTRLIVE